MQPGKGASVILVVMRDLASGNKDNVRLNTETVERVRLEQENINICSTVMIIHIHAHGNL